MHLYNDMEKACYECSFYRNTFVLQFLSTFLNVAPDIPYKTPTKHNKNVLGLCNMLCNKY